MRAWVRKLEAARLERRTVWEVWEILLTGFLLDSKAPLFATTITYVFYDDNACIYIY